MDNTIISENLIKLRKKKGLTQKELSEYLNVSDKTISKWETGVTNPDLIQLSLLSNFFEISIDELINNHIEEEDTKKETIDKRSFFKRLSRKNLFIIVSSTIGILIILSIILPITLIVVPRNEIYNQLAEAVLDYEEGDIDQSEAISEYITMLPDDYKKAEPIKKRYFEAVYNNLRAEMITMENKMKSITYIQECLNLLPNNYKDIQSIKEEFSFIKAQFDIFSDAYGQHIMNRINPDKAEKINYTKIRQAYYKLINADDEYSKWDLHGGAYSWVYLSEGHNLVMVALIMGLWEDEQNNYINIIEKDDNSIFFGTNLPSNKETGISYYYFIEGNTIGYVTLDGNIKFNAYRITEIKENYVRVYCFKNAITYKLSK